MDKQKWWVVAFILNSHFMSKTVAADSSDDAVTEARIRSGAWLNGSEFEVTAVHGPFQVIKESKDV